MSAREEAAMTPSPTRRVVPIREAFFWDGASYVLSSSSLGGSGLTAAAIGSRLQSEDPETVKKLLSAGICLPLHFPGDCALDEAVIVIGDLDEEEEREWLGRLRSKLEIPCGEFLVMGGGLEDDFEEALPNAEPPDPEFVYFQKVQVTPGSYLVEVYAFLSSLVVNNEWERMPGAAEELGSWWDQTRGSEPRPEWLAFFEDEEYVDSEEFGFLEYLIRLAPLSEDVPIPEFDIHTNWCTVSEFRRPALCPAGIPRSKYGTLP
jgi:hypothetical protein